MERDDKDLSHTGSKGRPTLSRMNALAKHSTYVVPVSDNSDDSTNRDPFRIQDDESASNVLGRLGIRADMLGIDSSEWQAMMSRRFSGELSFGGRHPEQEIPKQQEDIPKRTKSLVISRNPPNAQEPPRRNSIDGSTRRGTVTPRVSPLSTVSSASDSSIQGSVSAPGSVEGSGSAPGSMEGSGSAPGSMEVNDRSGSAPGSMEVNDRSIDSLDSIGSRSSDDSQSSSQFELEDRLLSTRVSWNWMKLDLLGSGSFGSVYRAVGSDGQFFAVKEVSFQGSDEQSAIQLQQEIDLLRDCRHENIVQYLGTERKQDKLYIFLELVTQGSLVSQYRSYPLFDEQIRIYTRQILNGLKYLHDRRVIHRDIKCANILVHANATVKLADFGMAKQLENITSMRSAKGSPYWMAPEVINPRKSALFPADIWSLGCTVLEMATGRPPFSDCEWHTVLWKVGHGELPPIPKDLPEDAKDFIAKCLQVEPLDRPTAAQLLDHPFVRPNSTALLVNHSQVTQVTYNQQSSTMRMDPSVNSSTRSVRSVRTRQSIFEKK